MAENGVPDYTDMSLDEVIRDMKARRRLQEGTEYGISPLLRPEDGGHQKNKFRFRNPQSEYSNYLAKKKVKNARQTLDLRRKLIHNRTNKPGVDLRWKLVALLLAKLKARYGAYHRRRFQPYPTMQSAMRPMGPPGSEFKMMGHPGLPRQRVKKSYVSEMEKLVGELPAWMTKPEAPQSDPYESVLRQPDPYQAERSEPRVRSGYGGLPFSAVPGTEYGNVNDGPEPLVYAPPVPVRPVLNEEPDFYSKAIPFNCHTGLSTQRRSVPFNSVDGDFQPPPLQFAPPAPSAPFGIRALPVTVRNPTAESLRELQIPIAPSVCKSYGDHGMSVHSVSPKVDAGMNSVMGGYSRVALSEIVIEVENSETEESRYMSLHERFSKS